MQEVAATLLGTARRHRLERITAPPCIDRCMCGWTSAWHGIPGRAHLEHVAVQQAAAVLDAS